MSGSFAPLGWLVGSPRRALAVLGFWILAAAVIVYVSPSLGAVVTDDSADFLPTDSIARKALILQQEKFPSSGLQGLVLVHRPSGITAADRDLAERVRTYLAEVLTEGDSAQIRAAIDLPATDGQVRTLSIVSDWDIDGDILALTQGAQELRAFLASIRPDEELILSFTGAAGITADLANTFSQFDFRVTLLTVLLVLLILLIVYRSPVMPLLALLGVGWSLLMAQFLAAWAADTFGLLINSQITALMSVLVFGAGTDYTVFVVARYREELRRNDSRWLAMQAAITRLGPAIAASGGTTVIVLALMLLASFGTFRGMGPILGLAVGLTIITGLTLIPALVVLAGRWIFWPIGEAKATRPSRTWQKIAELVTRHPWATLLVSAVLLIVFALGNTQLKQDFDTVGSLPEDLDSKIGFDILASSGAGGSSNPAQLLLELEEGSIYAHLPAVAQITSELEARPEIASALGPTRPFISIPQRSGSEVQALLDSLPAPILLNLLSNANAPAPADPSRATNELAQLGLDPPVIAAIGTLTAGQRFVSQDQTTAVIEIQLAANPTSLAAINQIPDLQAAIDDIVSSTSLNGVQPLLGGQTATSFHSREAVNRDTLVVIPLGYLMIFIILLVVLRSLVAAAFLAASVFTSLLAAIGLSVFIFEFILGHNGLGYQNLLWAFIFLTALGADYNILLISRVREECVAADTAVATRRAVASTGGVITSAGLILTGTFLVLTTFPLVAIVQIGTMVAVGILIDTFIVRTMLVPAIILVLGKWSWWPSDPSNESALHPSSAPSAATTAAS